MNRMWTCECGHYCAEQTCCHCREDAAERARVTAGRRRRRPQTRRRGHKEEIQAFLNPKRVAAQAGSTGTRGSTGAENRIKAAKANAKRGNKSKRGQRLGDIYYPRAGSSTSRSTPKWITAVGGVKSVVTNPVGNGKRR